VVRHALTIALAVGTATCALAARDHACYPYLAHQYRGELPRDLVRTLARERGTRRSVARHRAPTGYYWRGRRQPTLDVGEIRTVVGDYELARCPGLVPTDVGRPMP